MADLEFREIFHDWLSLYMEVPQHFVAPPASNEADDVIFNSGIEGCHSSYCPKVSFRDVMMRESHMGSHEEFYCGLEVGLDFSGGHVYPVSSS